MVGPHAKRAKSRTPGAHRLESTGLTTSFPKIKIRTGKQLILRSLSAVLVAVLFGVGVFFGVRYLFSSQDGLTPLDTLESLKVAPEVPATSRVTFPKYEVVGCSTSINVISNAASGLIRKDCKVTSGTWDDPFSDDKLNPLNVSIFHVVSLTEALDSGARSWDIRRRSQFKNDASNMEVTHMLTESNRAGADPGTWVPKEGVCPYLLVYLNVKSRYGLSVDETERAAISRIGSGTCKW